MVTWCPLNCCVNPLIFFVVFQISNENAAEPEKFIDRFKNLRKLNKYTDCQFKVDARVFQAHKLILAGCSSVFEAMFYGGMSSTNETTIKITDISGAAFSRFIDYAYTGQVLHAEEEEQKLQDLLELYYCGQKYLVDDLRLVLCDLLFV